MKRLCAVPLILFLLLFALPVSGAAETGGVCGALGDNLTWSLDAGGLFTVAPNPAWSPDSVDPQYAKYAEDMAGNMFDERYNFLNLSDSVPWDGLRQDIRAVEIRSGVTSLTWNCFDGCPNLTAVSLSDTVGRLFMGSMGMTNFNNCPALARFDVAEGNPNYGSRDGVLYGRDETGLLRTLLMCPAGVTALTVPEGVTAVAAYGLSGGNLTALSLPDSLTDTSPFSLTGCDRLTALTLGSGLERPGHASFTGLSALTDVFFRGTPDQWEAMPAAVRDNLSAADVHFLTPDAPLLQAARTDASVSAALYSPADGAAACCAFYDGSGRMLSLETVSLPAGRGVRQWFSAPPEGASARLFLLDRTLAPLAAAADLK